METSLSGSSHLRVMVTCLLPDSEGCSKKFATCKGTDHEEFMQITNDRLCVCLCTLQYVVFVHESVCCVFFNVFDHE